MVAPPHSMLAPLAGIAGAAELPRELLLDLHFIAHNIKTIIQGETEDYWNSAMLWEGITTLRRNEPFSKVQLPFPSQTPHIAIFFLPPRKAVVYLSLNISVERLSFRPFPSDHQPGFGWKTEHSEYGTMQMLSWAKLARVWIVGAPAMTVRWNNLVC